MYINEYATYYIHKLEITLAMSYELSTSTINSRGQQSWLSGRAQNSQAVDQSSRLKQL